MTKKISIYSTPSCTYCKTAKEYFNKNNIKYVEYDVSTDIDRRKEMVSLSEQMGVPVITIDDKFITGWDELKFNNLLY